MNNNDNNNYNKINYKNKLIQDLIQRFYILNMLGGVKL